MIYKANIIKTGDGSHTLFVPELNEHYHSVHGAIQESKHVFINQGFNQVKDIYNPIHILEVGFGTGLNCMLTWFEALKSKKKIIYHAIEPFPLAQDVWDQLNYCEFISNKSSGSIFNKLHASEWNVSTAISDNFQLLKSKSQIQDTFLKPDHYHLIYYDAFAPDVQPDMWTEDIFKRLFYSMNQGGVLVTYSAKGSVRRTLETVGYDVERIPGPPGKREMIRAMKVP